MITGQAKYSNCKKVTVRVQLGKTDNCQIQLCYEKLHDITESELQEFEACNLSRWLVLLYILQPPPYTLHPMIIQNITVQFTNYISHQLISI